MIIEGAFFKLPELLTSKSNHGGTLEATVVNLFAVAVIMEMNSRNIPRAFEHIHQEKPYPHKCVGQSHFRSDLYVDLDGAFSFPVRMGVYGARQNNWIEAKTFFSFARQSKSKPSKTRNAGLILRDLFRLCLLPSLGPNGRYMLLVFAGDPAQSIALDKGSKNREWLPKLITEGYQDLQIDLSNEPDTLRLSVGQGFKNRNWSTKLCVHTMMFQPKPKNSSGDYPLFWGYLIKIINFEIKSDTLNVHCEDQLGETYCSNVEDYWAIRQILISSL